MQYFTDMDINKPKQYTIDNDVKMPTLWWDLPSTGEDYTLGQALIKASGGTWLGGTNYVIKPDREIIHLPEGVSLRKWLEDNNVGKTNTHQFKFNNNLATFNVNFVNGNLQYFINNEGYYTFKIFNLNGKKIDQISSKYFKEGINKIFLNIKLSSGQYLLKAIGSEKIQTHKFLINTSK